MSPWGVRIIPGGTSFFLATTGGSATFGFSALVLLGDSVAELGFGTDTPEVGTAPVGAGAALARPIVALRLLMPGREGGPPPLQVVAAVSLLGGAANKSAAVLGVDALFGAVEPALGGGLENGSSLAF